MYHLYHLSFGSMFKQIYLWCDNCGKWIFPHSEQLFFHRVCSNRASSEVRGVKSAFFCTLEIELSPMMFIQTHLWYENYGTWIFPHSKQLFGCSYRPTFDVWGVESGFFHTLNIHIDLPLMCEVWKVDFSTLWTMDFPWSMFIHSISVAQRMSISHCWTGSSRRFLSQWVSLQDMVTIHGQNTFIFTDSVSTGK